MRKKQNFIVFALCALIVICYMLFFLLQIENATLFLFLTVGSVAVLSTITIYTVIHFKGYQDDKIRKRKDGAVNKGSRKELVNIIEDYFDAMPSVEEYIESNDSYEDLLIINKYIFSLLSQEELEVINLLGLTKIEKILFIREMLYFDASERKSLIEGMLKSRDKFNEEIIYAPPVNHIELGDQARVYIRSLVESGDKTKIIIVDTTELIGAVKKRISILFDYDFEGFSLSSGGIIMRENLQIKDYKIEVDDEIALIPFRKIKRGY